MASRRAGALDLVARRPPISLISSEGTSGDVSAVASVRTGWARSVRRTVSPWTTRLQISALVLLSILSGSTSTPSESPSSPLEACGGSTATKFDGVAVNHTYCLQLGENATLTWTLASSNSTGKNKTLTGIFSSPTAEPYGWVAFGLSPECEMEESSVLIAYSDPSDTSLTAVKPFYLNSTDPATAIVEPLPTFDVVGSPAAEVTAGGYAVQFSIQLTDSVGGLGADLQCVIFAAGPALSAAEFAKAPVPGFKPHSPTGSHLVKINFSSGASEASSSEESADEAPSTSSPSPSPPPPPKASQSVTSSLASTAIIMASTPAALALAWLLL